MERSIIYGEQVMRLLDRISDPELERRAMTHQMIGNARLTLGEIYLRKGHQYSARMEIYKAEKDLQTAYQIFDHYKQLTGEHFVSILGDLGHYYEAVEDHIQARKLLRRQLNMAQKYLSFDHPKQQTYFTNFISLYEKHGMRKTAMKIAWRKLKYCQERFGEIHPCIVQILMAMGFYERACRILFKNDPIDEQSIVLCLNELVRDKHSNVKTIGYLEKWFEYLTANYPSYERRIADTLRQMAHIYNDMGKLDLAHTYLHRSLSIYRYHHDHLNMRIVEDCLRHIE